MRKYLQEELNKRLLIQGTNNPAENSNKTTQGYMYQIQNDSIHQHQCKKTQDTSAISIKGLRPNNEHEISLMEHNLSHAKVTARTCAIRGPT